MSLFKLFFYKGFHHFFLDILALHFMLACQIIQMSQKGLLIKKRTQKGKANNIIDIYFYNRGCLG